MKTRDWKPRTYALAPGMRLHVLQSSRFPTTVCRVVLHRALGPDPGALAVLAGVLQAATVSAPSRAALAERLDMLYDAGLSVGVEKLGDNQALAASLTWLTTLRRSGRALGEGLKLLRGVLTQPLREPGSPTPKGQVAPLRQDLVARQRRNVLRALEGLRGDRAAYTVHTLLRGVCRDEPFGLDVRGDPDEVAALTGRQLAVVHADLLRTAPVDIWICGDVRPTDARRAVLEHLLWPGRTQRSRRLPVATGQRLAPTRPYRGRLREPLQQARLAYLWRGRVRPTAALAPAAHTLAGWLGGGAASLLFRELRERQGLCYDISARWHAAKAFLLVQTGVDPKDEQKLRRGLTRLVAAAAAGDVPRETREGWLAEQEAAMRALADHRGALLGWLGAAQTLGTSPDPGAWLARLRAVTPAQVRAVGKRLGLAGVQSLGPGRGS